MKKILVFVFLILLSGCAFQNNSTSNNKSDIENYENQKKEVMLDFAKEEGVSDIVFLDYEDFDNMLTIELQSKYEGENIIFEAYINDIYTDNGKTYIDLDYYFYDCIFSMESDNEIINWLIENNVQYDKYGYQNNVYIIANISSINRIHNELYIEPDDESYDVHVENFHTTIVKGKCISIKKIEESNN